MVPGPYDVLPMEAEVVDGALGADAERLADEVAAAFKRELGVTARVTLLPFGSLPRTEGKSRRVVRRRRDQA